MGGTVLSVLLICSSLRSEDTLNKVSLDCFFYVCGGGGEADMTSAPNMNSCIKKVRLV